MTNNTTVNNNDSVRPMHTLVDERHESMIRVSGRLRRGALIERLEAPDSLIQIIQNDRDKPVNPAEVRGVSTTVHGDVETVLDCHGSSCCSWLNSGSSGHRVWCHRAALHT